MKPLYVKVYGSAIPIVTIHYAIEFLLWVLLEATPFTRHAGNIALAAVLAKWISKLAQHALPTMISVFFGAIGNEPEHIYIPRHFAEFLP